MIIFLQIAEPQKYYFLRKTGFGIARLGALVHLFVVVPQYSLF